MLPPAALPVAAAARLPLMLTRPRLSLVVLAVALLFAGCGPSRGTAGSSPVSGLRGQESQASKRLGFPAFATKNTTRVGGADPVADAAGVAQAVFPSVSPATRPRVVALADANQVPGALAAAALMSAPLRAPILLSDGPNLPPASADALKALAPTGAAEAGGAQLIRVGDVAAPAGLRTASISGDDMFALARAVDTFLTRIRGGPSSNVVIVSADDETYAMPAAGWAAKSGDPILFVTRDGVPDQTRAALLMHQQPHIYVVGPGTLIPESVVNSLRSLGTVKRIRGFDPVSTSIAFARYYDGSFGWGAVDPGHGVVFANSSRPLDALAAAPLSASGTYGPLLLLDSPDILPPLLSDYLLDIQPGYRVDPVRGVYNHGWLIGDEHAISLSLQATLDAELEIVPVSGKTQRATAPTGPQLPVHPTAPPSTGGRGASGATGPGKPGATGTGKPGATGKGKPGGPSGPAGRSGATGSQGTGKPRGGGKGAPKR